MAKTYNLIHSKNYIYYLIAFYEGFVVMASELLIAKLMTPIYGDSFLCWVIILGVTLISLTAGYFMSSYLGLKTYKDRWLHIILCVTSILLAVMPFVGTYLIQLLYNMEIVLSLLIISSICLFPILFLLGLMPSIIIRKLSFDNDDVGRYAGTVFSVSTIAGIVSALAVGVLLIPTFGSGNILFAISIIGCILLFFTSRSILLTGLTLVGIVLGYLCQPSLIKDHKGITMLHKSDGLLGQIMVYDNVHDDNQTDRALYVNHIPQTMIHLESGAPYFSDYVRYLDHFISEQNPASDVLLLGLGGGNLLNVFKKYNHKVDAVEIDPRIADLAKQYFIKPSIAKSTNFIVDDARKIIRKSNKKYDIIVFDVFRGESPPTHVLTIESLKDLKKNMKPDGLVLINYIGNVEERGAAAKAIIKTTKNAGFYTEFIKVPVVDNVIIAARLSASQKTNTRGSWGQLVRTPSSINLSSAHILTDNKPILDWLHKESAVYNRTWYRDNVSQKLIQTD